MSTITIPKTEYKELKKIAERYKSVLKAIGFDVPTESLREYKNAGVIRKAYFQARKSVLR